MELLLIFNRYWQGKVKSTALPFAEAFCPDPSVVRLDKRLSNRQPDPASSTGASPGFIGPVKAVENERQVVWRNTDSSIYDGDKYLGF